ncbi:MAG TPA: hypothetical protein VEU50_14480, partial [Archangium sp.]
METPPLRPDTRTGNKRRVVVPSPSWPESLLPQPQTVPSLFTASVKSIPALSGVSVSARSSCTAGRDLALDCSPRWGGQPPEEPSRDRAAN